MTTGEIVIAVVLAIGAAELSDYLSWLAGKMAHASAYLRYGDTERAKVRAEEWVKLIEDRPGQILKLGTALGFLVTGAYFASGRQFRAARPARGSRAHKAKNARKHLVPILMLTGMSSALALGAVYGAVVDTGRALVLAMALALVALAFTLADYPTRQVLRVTRWSMRRRRRGTGTGATDDASPRAD
jgi:hypothetical protein